MEIWACDRELSHDFALGRLTAREGSLRSINGREPGYTSEGAIRYIQASIHNRSGRPDTIYTTSGDECRSASVCGGRRGIEHGRLIVERCHLAFSRSFGAFECCVLTRFVFRFREPETTKRNLKTHPAPTVPRHVARRPPCALGGCRSK